MTGCASIRTPRTPHENDLSRDVHDAQTESMRKSMDEIRPQSENSSKDALKTSDKTQKKKSKGFLYGGLSSEAREIEDHLYGN